MYGKNLYQISGFVLIKSLDIRICPEDIFFHAVPQIITKTRPFKYIETFTSKNWKKNKIEKLWYLSYFCWKKWIVGTH